MPLISVIYIYIYIYDCKTHKFEYKNNVFRLLITVIRDSFCLHEATNLTVLIQCALISVLSGMNIRYGF